MRTSTARGVGVLAAATAVAVAGLLPGGPASAAQRPAPTVPETRNPLLWPFAPTSIWNTPIGTEARYVAARIHSTRFGVDVDRFVLTRRADPAVPVYLPAAPGRCDGRRAQPQAGPQHLPRSLVIPDAIRRGSSAFLQPDGRTIVSYSSTERCRPGGPLYGRWSGVTSLYGDGIAGGHAGSGMSSIGGSLRTGELTGSDPIRHALKLEVWSRYLYDDAATGGRRWPALRANSGALTRYRGSVPALRMGALLALPPRATAERLGVRSAAGRKIVAALRDYGGYVVDDSGLDAVNLCVEHGAAADVARRIGHALEADPGLQADMARIVAALAVVDDNGPASVGGHGARRAPWAPPLRTAGSRGPAVTTRTTTPAPSPLPIDARQVAEVEPARDAPTVAVTAVAATALLLLALGLWGGRRLAGGRVTPRRGP